MQGGHLILYNCSLISKLRASLVAQLVKNLPEMWGTWVRSLGWEDLLEEMGYPLQYSWASLVAQLVKNLPAMWETWVQSLCWEDPLEKGKGYPLQYSGLENSMDCIVHGVSKSQTQLSDFHFTQALRNSGCSKMLFDHMIFCKK